jgi:flavin reductase (DIM6/NTAB) family NADH-FMN oxidoreductase RutF
MTHQFQSEDWAQWNSRYRAQFFNSLYGGRLVALLCTEWEGTANFCPVSQILHVGASPASLGILLRPESDTHQTRKYINLGAAVSLHWMPAYEMDRVHQSSAAYPEGQSEADAVGWAFHPAPVSQLALVCATLTLKESHHLFNETALYVFEIKSIASTGAPDETGFWEFEGGLLHSQGLDHYGSYHTQASLPYARP